MTMTRTAMTADDLWRMPSRGQRHELIRGELTMIAPAGGGRDPQVLREKDTLDADPVCSGFSVKVVELFQ